MSGSDPVQSSGKRPSLRAMLVEGLCVCACAHYPTAALLDLLEDLEARRSKPGCHEVGRGNHADCDAPPTLPHTRFWRADLHQTIERMLRQPWMDWTARTLLTLPFWLSGLAKLFAFDSGVAEMARAGLHPAVAFNIATITIQLGGSALIIANRGVWLGAGALGVFTGLTVLLVHRFWAITEEPFRTIALHVSAEHIGIIGGLLGIAILSARRDRP